MLPDGPQRGEGEQLGDQIDGDPVREVGGPALAASQRLPGDRAGNAVGEQAFRALEGRCTCPPGLPVCACGAQGTFRVLTRRAVQASDAEVDQNPRARSARLRAVEKVA